ncbi:MAG: D-alanine--D-alanine ligase, partial [Desulfobacteraceae bacterium]
MRIAVVHNAVGIDSNSDEMDVLVQADAITEALLRLGHDPIIMDCDLNLFDIRRKIEAAAPHLIFNLVESLAGTGRLIHLFPSLLDAVGISYTGASTEALFLTSNKIIAKRQLQFTGLPTPFWVGPYSKSHSNLRLPEEGNPPCCWIIKSVWEHASIGIDDTALIDGSKTFRLGEMLIQRASRLGGDCFAEEFIQGREFNLSILDSEKGPQVLPPAEILFEGFEESRPRIVGYEAKWDCDSYVYQHTPRRFDFDQKDGPLLEQLMDIALKCWRLFHLRG